jgi:hypothetical protein
MIIPSPFYLIGHSGFACNADHADRAGQRIPSRRPLEGQLGTQGLTILIHVHFEPAQAAASGRSADCVCDWQADFLGRRDGSRNEQLFASVLTGTCTDIYTSVAFPGSGDWDRYELETTGSLDSLEWRA